MEMMNNYGVLSILAVGLGLMARYFLSRLWNATQPSVRLGMMAGLFAVYTAGILLILWQIYRYTQELSSYGDTDSAHGKYHCAFCGNLLLHCPGKTDALRRG